MSDNERLLLIILTALACPLALPFLPIIEKEDKHMNKPLSEWTLGEIKAECVKRNSFCEAYGACPFFVSRSEKLHCKIMNDVGKVHPKIWDLSEPPRWTEQEVERVKAIKLIYPNAKSITKYARNTLLSNEKGIFAALSSSLFPSLELYASIALDEIIGGGE